MIPRKPRLLLCMTPGIGLARWQSLGSLDRELKPYVEYMERGWDVTIASCDRADELPPLPAGIHVVRCPSGRMLPWTAWTAREAFRQADLIKTNQSGGSWWFVAAAKAHRKPILLRCGWLPGSYLETRDGVNLRLRVHRLFEGWAFRQADASLVATEADREWVVRHYRVPSHRVHLRPNFVDTTLFCPGAEVPRPRSVISVGRLEAVKNPHLLIEACAGAGVSELCLVGDGGEKANLQALAGRLNVCVRFAGAVSQEELPSLLRQYEVFALPSRVEGHPKALFEAMACERPCLGASVPGIRTALRHGETGWLCSPDAASLVAGLRKLFADAALRRQLGSAARREVEATLSFATVMDSELDRARALLPQVGRRLEPLSQPV